MGEPAVRFEHVSKRFGGVQALRDVSLEIAAGSCHALCGENGAGKSTLGKLLAGIHAPESGRLFVFGTEVRFETPRDALKAGVGMVHQELAFCDNLSVAENLCLGGTPSRMGFVQRTEMQQYAETLLAEIGTTLDVGRRLGELTIAQQQMVQIAAALRGGARIIVFDEPTSSLGHAEADRLYELIGRLKQRGVTCIFVSHRMSEIFRLCDAVSVMRDGSHVATLLVQDLTESTLVELMIGRPLAEYLPRHADAPQGEEVLRVERLSVEGKFEDVSFSIRAGEVVGLAGLVGAGRSEVAAALFGLERNVGGAIHLGGRRVRIRSAGDAIRLGIGLVPEDRKRQGLVLSHSGVRNTGLPILRTLSRLTWVNARKERALTQDYFDRLRIRAPGIDSVVGGLSGGNQQKVVLAKWLAARTRVLILDEPTRGVDIGAKTEIHALIGELAARGTAILLISSELPEILSLSSRIMVLRAGRIVGEMTHAEATQARLLRLMAGLEMPSAVGPGGASASVAGRTA